MIIVIDLLLNKIEVQDNKEPDLDLKSTLENISNNLDSFDIKQISIAEKLQQIMSKIFFGKVSVQKIDPDAKPGEPTDK